MVGPWIKRIRVGRDNWPLVRGLWRDRSVDPFGSSWDKKRLFPSLLDRKFCTERHRPTSPTRCAYWQSSGCRHDWTYGKKQVRFGDPESCTTGTTDGTKRSSSDVPNERVVSPDTTYNKRVFSRGTQRYILRWTNTSGIVYEIERSVVCGGRLRWSV